jgi:hypothetical protein
VIWSWMSFASGYVLGGLSGILVLGIFIVGSKGEAAAESPMAPEILASNSVVKFDLVQSARKTAPGSVSRRPATSPLSDDSGAGLGYSPE